MTVTQLVLPDGRALDYGLTGDECQPLLVLHLGSPGAVTDFPPFAEAAGAAGLRLVICSRPGYGGSTRRPGHRVADAASDTAALADHLDVDHFLVAGWSGGGPAALACAALLPDRVRACVTLAGIAPIAESDGAWRDWYGPDDREEIEALQAGRAEDLIPAYETAAAPFASITAPVMIQGPSTNPADRSAYDSDPRATEAIARSLRLAVSSGIWGWLDDGVAHANEWGFSLADIRVPLVVRHGDDDRLVPVAQGRWLAEHIPGAVLDEVAGGGHGSVADPFAPVVATLLALADGRLG